MAEQTEIFVEEWNKKRIAFGICFLLLLIGGIIAGKQYILPLITGPETTVSVKGASTENIPTAEPEHKISLPTAQDLQTKVEDLQQQVTSLDVQEIASSSPQVQQILEQIQRLPQLPRNIAKEQCLNICSKL